MTQSGTLEIDEGVSSERFIGWLGLGRAEMRKRERTRTDLLVAGANFLAAQPPERLTVSAVCKAAGVAHGTFYLHFSDRNDLAGCVLSSFVDYLQAEMRAAARGSGDATRNATAAYMRLFEENCGLMKCMVVGVDAFPQAQEMFQRLNHEWIETVVRAARRRPGSSGLTDADLMRRAYALGGMVDQYLAALFVTNDPWIRVISQDREAVLDMFTDLWRKGMSP
jgi:TetR/AcrR family transcriptional regulator, ethionamide resistance regulator